MSRRKGGERISGWVILDKPLGMSSNAALQRVRRILNANKAGHAGTLDPLATGVLPIALGEATKAISLIVADKKSYRFTVAFGEARSTDDAEGEVIAQSPRRPDRAAILGAIPEFLGFIAQRPPDFSAIQQQGLRAYDAARSGNPLSLPPRTVRIDRLELIGFEEAQPDHAEFEMDCGPGTYVRSIARDLGERLGCFAYVARLRRTRVGKINESMAISLDKLAELRHSVEAIDCVLPIVTQLDDIPAVPVSAEEARLLRLGQAIAIGPTRESLNRFLPERTRSEVIAVCGGEVVALGKIKQEQFCPYRIFNLNP